MRESLIEQLTNELASFGISCDERATDLLVRHLELVIEKNQTVNLTRITDPREAVTLHVLDSLLPLAVPGLVIGEGDRLLDMGTGAGFPGLPLAIVTGCEATLVDSVTKKVTAVSEFVGELGLSRVTAVHARLEELARTMPRSQSRVIARAVAQTNVLIEYATPFLCDRGQLIVEKGRPTDEEIEAAEGAASLCGLKLISRDAFELPRDLGHREILVYKRVSRPRVKLPRKPGDAKRNPLH